MIFAISFFSGMVVAAAAPCATYEVCLLLCSSGCAMWKTTLYFSQDCMHNSSRCFYFPLVLLLAESLKYASTHKNVCVCELYSVV